MFTCIAYTATPGMDASFRFSFSPLSDTPPSISRDPQYQSKALDPPNVLWALSLLTPLMLSNPLLFSRALVFGKH